MKKYLSLFLIALMFCAVVSVGCGGGSDNDASVPEQTDNVTDNTGGDTDNFDPHEEGRSYWGRKFVDVYIRQTGNYKASEMSFYAREAHKKWEKVKTWDNPTDDPLFQVSKNYFEFGFEFNTKDGVQWPYSGRFWTQDPTEQRPYSIRIEIGGTSQNPSIRIIADFDQCFYDSSCKSHTRRDWGYLTVEFDCTLAYTQYDSFYGRTSSGNWVQLILFTSEFAGTSNNKGARLADIENDVVRESDQSFSVPKEYVEFGFEFDIMSGTHWPYSDVFWTEDQSKNETVNTISITTDGTVRYAGIIIKVNDQKVVDKFGCSDHAPYYFKTDWHVGKIRVLAWRTAAYQVNATNFYARKSENGAWTKYDKWFNSDRDQVFYIQESEGYVEFGFEFDIMGGTDWPYSGRFWKASDSAQEKADNIYIEMGGLSLNSSINIWVNRKNVKSDSNCSGHLQYYWNTNEHANEIRVKVWKTSNYRNNTAKLYGRKSANDEWICEKSWTNGDQEFYIPEDKGYVEYGFEFDIEAGTDWPYSGVFWTEADSAGEKVEDISIEMGGAIRSASIRIHVNGIKKVDDSNCYAHERYDWDRKDSKIQVSIYKPGWFSTNARNFYARKAGGAWERKYKLGDNYKFTIDSDYVEFGFEFDIEVGTKWPYTNVFWTEDDSRKTTVRTIEIRMDGTILFSHIYIYVNGTEHFNYTNCPSHTPNPAWNALRD